MENLGLIVKATRLCNLRCTYCHDWRSRAERMSFETLALLTKHSVMSEGRPNVEFIWHGGEPLLLGIDFYAKAIFLQEHFRAPGQGLANSLQTNGTLVTAEWCKFFRDSGFNIGVSIDGPRHLHDVNRRSASGRGTFDDTLRALELLNRHDVPYGALMVLNRRALAIGPEALFDFFADDLGIKSWDYLPVRPTNEIALGIGDADYVTPDEFSDFMIRTFDKWYGHHDSALDIRELTALLKSVLGGTPTVCTLAGDCIGEYFHVESNGDVYHCDKFLGDVEYLVGNFRTESFSEIRRSEAIRKLVEGEQRELSDLSSCSWYSICHGGCPHDRYVARRYLSDYSGSCCGLAPLIRHIHQRVEQDLGRVGVRAGLSDSSVWEPVAIRTRAEA